MKKPSRTQLNIKAINSYINKIGAMFGTVSKQYEKIVNQIADFEIYTNKKGYINIRDTKENRNKHQKIRAINKRKIPFFILKRKAKKAKQTAISIGLISEEEADEKGDAFDRWYSEITASFSDLIEEIYSLKRACEEYGIDLDVNTAFESDSYRKSKWNEVYNAMKDDTISDFRNSDNETYNPFSGEVYEASSDDFYNPDFFD